MKTKTFIILLVFAFLVCSQSIHAQENSFKDINKFSIGLNFGSLLPYGDIKQNDYLPTSDELKWGGGLILNYQISSYLSLQGQFLIGELAGSKSNFTQNTGPYHDGLLTNLKFNTEFFEFGINTTVSLNRLLTPCYKFNNRWNIYALAGLGYINFRSQSFRLDTLTGDYDIYNYYGWKEDGTVKDKLTRELILPLGLGVKFKISNKFDVYLESTMRLLFSDKLDAYVRPYNFNDKYGYTSIGFIYRFGKKEKKHMEWVLPVCKDDDSVELSEFLKLKKKADDLEDQVEEIEAKCCEEPAPVKDYTDEINQLNKRIKDLEKQLDEIDTRIKVNEEDLQPGADLGELININPIYFDFNKANIRPDAAIELDKIVEIMNRFPSMEIELGSHTDCRGRDAYNMDLSQRRAVSSAQYVKSRITNPERIYGKGYGETRPKIECNCDAASNSDCTEEQHQLNRRTEFIIIKR